MNLISLTGFNTI